MSSTEDPTTPNKRGRDDEEADQLQKKRKLEQQLEEVEAENNAAAAAAAAVAAAKEPALRDAIAALEGKDAAGSQEIVDAFEQHRKECPARKSGVCIFCHGIFDPSATGVAGFPDELLQRMKETATKVELQQRMEYQKFEPTPDFSELPVPTAPSTETTIRLWSWTLREDLKLHRNVEAKRETYFDMFYISFLRQVLETFRVPVDSRELLVKSPQNETANTGTKRKADLVAWNESKGKGKTPNTYMVLESALGKYGRVAGKVSSDKTKLAMEMHHEAKRRNGHPPLAIFTFQRNGQYILEVYTLHLVETAWTLIVLDTFETTNPSYSFQ